MSDAIKVNGLWDEGYVMCTYVDNSVYIGEDVFGHPQFKTTYSSIGKLLHAMKYNGHFDTSKEIADLCIPFLKKWIEDKSVDIILPVPATTERVNQPVYMIAEVVANELSLYYSEDVLKKISGIPSKNMDKASKDLSNTIIKLKPAKKLCNILLIDDFYSTGSTANECVSVLKEDPLIKNIYYFAIAKTKQ